MPLTGDQMGLIVILLMIFLWVSVPLLEGIKWNVKKEELKPQPRKKRNDKS